MLQILYLAHRIPYPPDKGEKIRAFHQIRHLSREHALHLACLVDDRRDLAHVPALAQYCASVTIAYRNPVSTWPRAALALAGHLPLSVAPFYSDDLQRHVDHLLASRPIDRVFVFSSAMAQYVRASSRIPTVIDFVDVDSEKWRLYSQHRGFPLSWLYRLEAARLARYEERISRDCAGMIFVSRREARLFQRCAPDRAASVIPNGVDLEYFRPRADGGIPSDALILFIGTMDYFPNADAVAFFCERIFPLVHEGIPQARFYIVGRNPTRSVRALARHHHVVVTGGVPDVRPYLAEARVVVAPFRIACGLQNKVLEALAMGVPVVATPATLEGAGLEPGDGALSAATPKEFAEGVVRLLKDTAAWRVLSRRGRQVVEERHQWSVHAEALSRLIALDGRSPGPDGQTGLRPGTVAQSGPGASS